MKFLMPFLAVVLIFPTALVKAQTIFCENAKLIVGRHGLELKTGTYKNAQFDKYTKKRSNLVYGIYENGMPSALPVENSSQNLWLNRCGVVASQDLGTSLREGEYYVVSNRAKCYESTEPSLIPHSWTAEIRGLKNGSSAYIACYSSGAEIDLAWINRNLAGLAELQPQGSASNPTSEQKLGTTPGEALKVEPYKN